MTTLHHQNAELFYQTGGKTDVPALLLLHGGLGAAEDFAALLPRLQQHFFVIAADTRGHGRSTRGTAAYRLAAQDARVQSVITVGANWHSRQIEPLREMFGQLSPDFFRENMAEQVSAYEAANPQPDLAALSEDLRHLWLDTTDSGYPDETVARIQAPVLAARGEGDFLLSLADLADLQTHLPDAHLMNIPFAGHEAVKEQPDILWAAIRAFYDC